ncbi:MAG: hypothetical protein QOI24_484 [Acidobacteriota bacterium]|jgi:hypothetical protein|nr:hypothetical protein [Acidobacteriota bacterium]
MKQLLGVVCALVAMRAGADTLFDVKATVNRLAAKTPIHATFALQRNVKTAGRFANDNTARNLSVEVTHDASGMTFVIPQPLLDKASQESHTHAEDNAAQSAIDSISPGAIVEAIDFRDRFISMVEGSTVTEEKRVVFRGKPARLLVLKLSTVKRKHKNSVEIGDSKSDQRLNLWIGDDNLPIAAERTEKTTAGFMMIKATHEARTNYTFAHTADRFFVARVETNGSGSGLGQNFEESSVQTVTLH